MTLRPWQFDCPRCHIHGEYDTAEDLAAAIWAVHPRRCSHPLIAWVRRLLSRRATV